MEEGLEIQTSLLSTRDPMLQDANTDCEVSRMHFRQFQYSEAAGPWENFHRLWELCCQWLKPKVRSIEQVLELLVLEQFLTILPTEIESRVSAYGPESREKLFALIEHLQRERETTGHQFDMRDVLFDELAPFRMVPPLPEMRLEPPALPLMGPVQEALVPGAWSPQAGPLGLNYGAAGECLHLLDPGHAVPQPDWSYSLEPGLELYTEELQDSESLEQSSDSKRDRNALCGHNLLNNCEHLEVPQETSSEELLSIGIEKPCLGQASQSADQKLPLKPRANKQKPNTTNPYCYPPCAQQFAYNRPLPCYPKIQTGEPAYKCHKCGRQFLHQSDLDKHQHTHTKEKPFQCTQCSMQFTQLAHLTQHESKHLQKQSYQCPVCRQNFALWSSLTEHRKTHNEGKSHECQTCGKCFNRRATLLQHQRIHTAERQFICDYGPKSYRYRSSLIIHRRTHTGEKPYKCSLCSKGFIKKADLTTHQAAHFREEFPNNTSAEMGPAGSSNP
ncbi:zinc finger protein 449-like [Heterocephalus glaber]|uniref:Zinc finger protein 449-like n=1 Tax=Heterocephalus glaber TaxID=10181 RepID=A0AAX6SI15_HETGA|nr:zinc finger protein 449-like [Heterocephalus glaber]